MAIAVDQANLGTKAGDTATTVTVVTTQPIAVGGFIVAAGGWFVGTDKTPAVSGGGLSWTMDKSGLWVPLSISAFIATAQVPAGLSAGASIVMTLSGGVDPASALTMGLMSFTGVKTSSPVDGTPLGPTGVSTAGWSSGNYSISAGSVLVGVDWNGGAIASHTPTAPALEAWEVVNGVDFYGATGAYRIEASAGSYAVAGTWNAAHDNVNVAVAYLAAAGGVPDTQTRRHQIRRSRMTSW